MLDLNTSMHGKVILGICAHPDDLEFGASGTFAKWIREGAEGYYIILTDGSKGSEDISIPSDTLKETRYAEQEEAGKVVGLKEIFFLDYVDGELMNTPDVRQRVVRIIRKIRPDVVISQDPAFIYDAEAGFINHPDHRIAGQIALDCIFPFARNMRTFSELLEEDLTSHKVADILLTNFRSSNFFVDITNTIDVKLDALSCHRSQQEDPEATRGFVRERAKRLGEGSGMEFAEGFIKISLER